VTTKFGDSPSNPRISLDDRQAVSDVQDAIKTWGGYVVVYAPKHADLVVLFEKAHG
jgi:hypothetical protein